MSDDAPGFAAALGGHIMSVSEYKPGSFGCHELLDRTSLLANQIETWLLDHPACLDRPEFYALAERAASALHELYQRIGEVHLDAQEANS
jgi:hypothetical protein